MNAIEANGLTKEFDGKTVLNNVNFEVREGEVFGFLGPNGAGKTTTMRIVLGLLRASSGRASVFGQELGDNGDLRRRVGVLLENDGLYERLSAYENLIYYAQLYSVFGADGRCRDLLDFMGLSERRHDRVGEFSRGMRRKLGLARSLVHDPDVLFYDEPSAGLDPGSRRMVGDLILRLAREEGKTVFLNSHDLEEVQRVCSRVAILHRGEIRADDTIDNLRKPVRSAVEVSLADDEGAERALFILNSMDHVCVCARNGLSIIATMNGEETAEIIGALIKDGIRVEGMRRATASLEEIYLEVISRSPEGGQ